MTGREREARRLRTLVGRLRRDWDVAEQVHARLERATERVAAAGADEITVGAVAVYLQNVYTAVEELLQRIATDLDGSVPGGTEWHRELIDQVSIEVPGLRPAVTDAELRSDLDLLRRFRHVVRHAYAEPYDWEAMQDALAAETRVMTRFPERLEAFEAFLTETAEGLERGGATDATDDAAH